MQIKRNPWISTTDLFSSVVLVVLLLFVMAEIIPKFTQEAQRRDMMEKIETALTVYEQQGQVKVHTETGMLEFTSVTFDSGSAELTPKTKLLVKDLSENLIGYMAENPMLELLIEGHTDPAAIHAVINRGGYFEDNIQLSTLRAANVRKELLASMGKEYANRIGVAGYGDTRLKNTEQPVSPDNRRIEIRLLWKGQSAQ